MHTENKPADAGPANRDAGCEGSLLLKIKADRACCRKENKTISDAGHYTREQVHCLHALGILGEPESGCCQD